MHEVEYNIGDIVYSVSEILNDGSLPEYPEQALIAKKGARGVVVNEGHLGPAVGVWPEELTQKYNQA